MLAAGALAVEAGGGHGFHPHRRMAAQPEASVGAHPGHPLGQFTGAGHPQRLGQSITGHRQAGVAQGLGNAGVGGYQRHQPLFGAERGCKPATTGIEIGRGDQAVEQQV